jgi:signal-transduction protein with cAMP-binding, CBS, and nucleotidyltransferase domain
MKSVDKLMDLVKTTVNRDLSKGIPVLASVVRLANLFFDNPLSGIANITDIIKDMEIVRSLLVTTNTDTQQILHDISDIVNTLTRLLTSIMSDLRG